MLKVNAEEFVEAANYLAQLRHVAEKVFAAQKGVNNPLTQADRDVSHVDERLRDLRTHCEALKMRLTVKQINRCLNDDTLTPQSVNAYAAEIFQRFRDELSERRFYSLKESQADFFETPRDGWETGIAKFPSIAADAEEASKCYALERSTASVFHMMRVLEAPLAVIAKELGVTKHSPTWNAYLEAFKTAAVAKFPASTGADKRMRDYFAGLEAQLRAIKDAFRNPTMHSLERTYTQETAHELLILVRGFLRQAAEELSE